MHDQNDRGQAAIVVVAVCATLLVVILGAVATMGRTTTERIRAQNAADAAALASLDGGRARATAIAAANGADVVSWSTGPGPFEVSVTVRVGNVTATARASNAP